MDELDVAIASIDTEVGRGYWEVEIKWAHNPTIESPTLATVPSFTEVALILAMYGDYSSCIIKFVPFTKREDL